MFRQIKGQARALGILEQAAGHDRVAQAYLFHGIDGVGKFTCALYFGMALNCVSVAESRPCGKCPSCRKFMALASPDLIYLFPTPNFEISEAGEIEKNADREAYLAYIRNKIETPWQDYGWSSRAQIRLDNIRNLTRRLELSSREAKKRICIIENADSMNTAAANAFLKTLEEPPADTVVILITERLSLLPATVISRCQQVYFAPLPPSAIEEILTEAFHTPRQQARVAARIGDGSVKRAIWLAGSDSAQLRDIAFQIVQWAALDKALDFYHWLWSPPFKFTAETASGLIDHVKLFLGDLILVRTAPDEIVNIDKQEYLTELSRGELGTLADRIWLHALSSEDLIRKIRGNVNLNLVLIKLFFDLQKVFAP